MKSIVIEGSQRLNGKIEISGMKNSALPIIFACILVSGETVLHNVPRVSDVENALEINISSEHTCDKHSNGAKHTAKRGSNFTCKVG